MPFNVICSTKNTLISKLISHEKATFDEATGAQMQEMLDDKAIQGLLNSVATTAKASAVQPNKCDVAVISLVDL